MPSSLYQDLPDVLDVTSNISFVVPVGVVVVQAVARAVQHTTMPINARDVMEVIVHLPFQIVITTWFIVGSVSCYFNTSSLGEHIQEMFSTCVPAEPKQGGKTLC